MVFFVRDLLLAYVACTFLVTGTFHAVRFGRLTQLIVAHRIVPPAIATVAGAALLAFELTVGALALTGMLRGRPTLAVAGLSAVAGLVFVLYVRRLLHEGRGIPCGCSPVAEAASSAALVPAAALLVVGALSLLVEALAGAGAELPHLPARFLAGGWGLVLASTVMLLPAVAPTTNNREEP